MPRKRYVHMTLTFRAWDTVVRELQKLRDADMTDTDTRVNLETLIARLRNFWSDYRKDTTK